LIGHVERYITFLSKLLNRHDYSPQTKEKEGNPKHNSKTFSNFKSFLDNLSSRLFSPLKNTLKSSLQDYIPKSHLNDNLLDDVTDTILNFFHDQFSTIKGK